MEFSKQKVHDILEAVNQSLEAAGVDIPFISLFDGHAQQNGNIEELLAGLCSVFPEQFHEASMAALLEKSGMTDEDLSRLANGNLSNNPDTDEYWELGVTELELFKQRQPEHIQDSIDTVQEALSILNAQDLIDGEGNVIGRDLRRVLKSDLGLNEIINFTELDGYLEQCCGNLLSSELVTIGKHESNGRTRIYNFLNSPFSLR